MQEQHLLLRLELEQPRMRSNRRNADVRVRRVVCPGASFGLLASGVSFRHARCVNPHQVCGSSSHRRVDPSFLMSARLVHRWLEEDGEEPQVLSEVEMVLLRF